MEAGDLDDLLGVAAEVLQRFPDRRKHRFVEALEAARLQQPGLSQGGQGRIRLGRHRLQPTDQLVLRDRPPLGELSGPATVMELILGREFWSFQCPRSAPVDVGAGAGIDFQVEG